MPLTLEPVLFALRWGKRHFRYGDDYEGIGTAVRVGKIVWVYGLSGDEFNLTKQDRKTIKEFCKTHGFIAVHWESKDKDGILRERVWRMPKGRTA